MGDAAGGAVLLRGQALHDHGLARAAQAGAAPRPPVIVGGTGAKRTPALAARFADEFNVPFAARRRSPRSSRGWTRRAGRSAATRPSWCARSHRRSGSAATTPRSARALTLGRDAADLRANGLAGTVAEVVDRLGQWREKTGITRIYLQLMDMADLDQVELIAAEVAPQLG